MDISAALANVNYLAMVVGAVVMFVLGALWYSPVLFAKTWMAELNLKEEDMAGGNMAMTFLASFVMMLVMAFTIALFLRSGATWLDGIKVGVVAGVGLVTASMAINYIYERKSSKLLFINAAYQVIGLVIIGVIQAVW